MSTSLVKRKYTTWKFTDPSVDVSDLKLSPFQIEKLSYLFKCLDTTGDGYINVSLLLLQNFDSVKTVTGSFWVNSYNTYDKLLSSNKTQHRF